MYVGNVRRILAATLVAILAGLAGYATILCMPQPLFAYSVTSSNITLHCDTAFSADAGRTLLDLARAKLEASPLYRPGEHHDVFICNTWWRRLFFFNRKARAGGLSYYPLTYNVFLRDGLIDENRILTTTGKRVPGVRTLDYFVAHELTHALTGRSIGWIRYYRLPVWVREGYADYVGKGRSLNYREARRAFLAGARDLDPARSGLYLRYHLLVAHYLDKEHWTVKRLLETTLSQAIAEDAVRKEPQ
jgi:hypothetical protein